MGLLGFASLSWVVASVVVLLWSIHGNLGKTLSCHTSRQATTQTVLIIWSLSLWQVCISWLINYIKIETFEYFDLCFATLNVSDLKRKLYKAN